MEKDKYEYPKKKYEVVSHMVAWVIRILIESLSLYLAVAIFFIVTNWKLALSILIVSPFVFLTIYMFKTKVAPMHAKLREKLAQMNTYAQENISGNKVVKAFAREDYEIDKFDKANTDYRDTNKATGMVWLKFLFSGTIEDNIRYGKLDANMDEIK